MIFERLPIRDGVLIKPELIGDERGFFSRVFCMNELSANGLENNLVQVNHSFSKEKGTLRGIHYQVTPFQEVKMVRCLKGSVQDVIVDLRPESETYLEYCSVILSDQNKNMLYVPKGFGHAFLTLEDNVDIMYFVTEYYNPNSERILRWDEQKVNIEWIIKPTVISKKDSEARAFDPEYHLK
tara:strand:- start:50 stop:595 length:546 start_codon:yes stop_codon:yes gene_type:complete